MHLPLLPPYVSLLVRSPFRCKGWITKSLAPNEVKHMETLMDGQMEKTAEKIKRNFFDIVPAFALLIGIYTTSNSVYEQWGRDHWD